MKPHLYLSLVPEALILSMLPPEEFGNYLAVGTHQRSRGQAIFFELDPDFESDYFRLDAVKARCIPHPDGAPRRSVYASIYRCLENVPPEALKDLYLTTDDGSVLALQRQDHEPETERELHLYQELCPVTPTVVSRLDPPEFCRFITAPDQPLFLPRLAFCELKLGELALDPARGRTDDLPYPNIGHLRDCLLEVQQADHSTKTYIRDMGPQVMYRVIRNGFFVGDRQGLHYYPLPSRDDLEKMHYVWWRSALRSFTR